LPWAEAFLGDFAAALGLEGAELRFDQARDLPGGVVVEHA
jgi:hypothetical protein